VFAAPSAISMQRLHNAPETSRRIATGGEL
jgi:hypothetical protein